MGNVRLHKIVRDLVANKARSILVVLSIAVGVFAFASVFTANEILLTAMDDQYRAVTPSTLIVSINSFDEGLVRWATLQDGVKAAEGRVSRVVKLKKGAGSSIMTLLGIKDFDNISVNKVTYLGPSNNPQVGGALIERSSVKAANIQVGSDLNFETPNGDNRTLRVVGVVHDINAVPTNLFPLFSVYVSLPTLRSLGFSDTYNQMLIATDNSIVTKADASHLADRLKKEFENKGYNVGNIEVRTPNTHWAKDITQAFTIILNVVGTFSLIMSAFLVVNTVTALITREKKQIGIMKAVGGVNRQITFIYLASVATFGLLGLFVALPIGLVLAYGNLWFIANFLNINVTNFYLPTNVFLLEVATSLLVPLVASAIPIFRGIRVSVVSALMPSVASTKTGHGLVGRFLYTVRNLPRPVLLSFRNTFQNIGRLTLTMATLIVAGVLFISVLSVRSSLSADMEESLKVQNYDISLYLGEWYGKDQLTRQAMKIPEIEAVGVQVASGSEIVDSGETSTVKFDITGVEPEKDFFVPQITSGRWLNDSDKNAIVVSTSVTRDHPDLVVGRQVTLKVNDHKTLYTIVGSISLSQGQGDNPTVYTTYKDLSKTINRENKANALLIRMKKNASITQDEMVTKLENNFKEAGFLTSVSVTTDTLKKSSEGQFNFLVAFLLFLAIMVAAVGGLGLTGTMSLNVLERTREIGILRGIGAGNSDIRKMVLVEGIVIGLVSYIISLPLSIPASYLFGFAIGMAFSQKPLVFSFSFVGVVIWLIIVLGISSLASLIPARRASKTSVRDALSYE